VLSANIVSDENFLYQERFGMAKKRVIVSKKNLVMFYEIGIYIILIHHREKNVNLPKELVSQQHKYQIGLKIDGNEIELPIQLIGKSTKNKMFVRLVFSFCRKGLDMSPSHNDDNSLDDLGSTGSEPTAKGYSIDYNTPQYHHYHHHHHHQHHMKPIGTDLVDSGGIFKDYQSL